MSESAPRWLLGVAFLSLFVVFQVTLYLIIGAYSCAHPSVTMPRGDRGRFARVAILMNGSTSDRSGRFSSAKKIIQTMIIPSLGPHDVALCYDVQPGFSRKQNTVFGVWEDQPLRSKVHSMKILEVLHQNLVTEETYSLIRALSPEWKRVEGIRSSWARKVAARKQSEGRSVNICDPLRDLGRWLRLGDPDSERWLFVFSDLRHEAYGQACRTEEVQSAGRILLVHPFDPEGPTWEEMEAFSRRFFGEHQIERIPFFALTNSPLLPPNPTVGLEAYTVPTLLECARPRLKSALLTCGGLIALIWPASWWIARRIEPTMARPPSTHDRDTLNPGPCL